jgi:hypothetical protein
MKLFPLVGFLTTITTPRLFFTNILPRKDSVSAVVAIQQKYHIPPDHSILLREEHALPPSLDTTSVRQVTMEQLLTEDHKFIMPPFHVYSRFHHDFLYGRYATILPYPNYCGAEEKVAQMVVPLLRGSEPVLLIVQRQEWLYDESWMSFLTSTEKQLIDTTLMVDLDVEPSLPILPRAQHTLLFWNPIGRPIM